MLQEGHSLEYSLVQTFPHAPNPLLTSIEAVQTYAQKQFKDSPFLPALTFLLKGIPKNRKKTLALTEDLVRILDRNYQVEQKERKFRESLLFKSYVASAGIAGSLGVISILTLTGFLKAEVTFGNMLTSMTIVEVVNVFLAIISSLSISLLTTAESIAENRKEKIGIFIIGLTTYTLASFLTYSFISTL
ncbi:MAG: hypothetical protein GWO20_01285 [Candidatus Korarchaeota archaeon]|nr:hypothetical protein [Candidatus Korarchaeota archaeon]NIU83078.1 hypothetical protein [Candidatus Thorarchaeota archaeon]NIW12622.1 hypothetical protein [Candidatus Thorarchaeota archaeon]